MPKSRPHHPSKSHAPVKVQAPVPVKKAAHSRQGFRTHEHIVYPAHGVGQIVRIEEQEIAGNKLELFVISFAKDKMTLRVPTSKAAAVGMRKLAGPDIVKKSLDTLKGRARVKRTMWSRRAQEYEAKINSGNLISIAEVVRDLFRSESSRTIRSNASSTRRRSTGWCASFRRSRTLPRPRPRNRSRPIS